jgi:hypothetical protein
MNIGNITGFGHDNNIEVEASRKPQTVSGRKEALSNKVKGAVAVFFAAAAIVGVGALASFLTAGAVIPLTVGLVAGFTSLGAIGLLFGVIFKKADERAFQNEQPVAEPVPDQHEMPEMAEFSDAEFDTDEDDEDAERLETHTNTVLQEFRDQGMIGNAGRVPGEEPPCAPSEE